MSLRALRYLWTPIWAAQLASGANSFVDNPIIGNATLNAFGLHTGRIRLAHRLARVRRARLARLITPEDRAAYERDGFVLKQNFLPDDLFHELLDQIRSYRGTVRETRQGDALTRRIAAEPAVLEHMPALRALLSDPRWRGLVRYVGADASEPINYIQTVLTRVDRSSPDPQLSLHADTFYPTVKAWLFLTDVAEDAAPFTYVPGSHRMTPERLAWEKRVSIGAAASSCRLTARGAFRVQESELPALNLPPPRRFAVPANTLVVADTCGFHARGPSEAPTCRVEIWAYGRRNPFLPWAGLDVLHRLGVDWIRAPLYWQFRDFLERHRLGHNVWKARPDRSAFDPG